jgi:hypothetical protein
MRRTTHLALALALALALVLSTSLAGCALKEADPTNPNAVTETGYLKCDAEPGSCGATEASCEDIAGFAHCVQLPAACAEVSCTCLGALICGTDACHDLTDGGIQCGTVEEPGTTTGDPNEPADPNDPTDPNDPNDPNDPTDPVDPNGVDTDSDGTPDSTDCAPMNAQIHPNAAEACNGLDDDCDGVIDEGVCDEPVVDDTDEDGIVDLLDNCPDVPNPAQQDCDSDGLGDLCDDDPDNDGIQGWDGCCFGQFLTQGCGEGDGVPFTAGCYSSGELGCQSDTQCADGLACQEIVYDPCWNAACDACGAYDTMCLPPTNPTDPGDPNGGIDTDGDGFADAKDCAPNDPNVFPGAPEICNAIDDDCDGMVDEDGCP